MYIFICYVILERTGCETSPFYYNFSSQKCLLLNINKYINKIDMRIDIYEPENMLYLKSLTEEELFNECGKDQRMFNDFIRHIKSHPYAKPLHEYWFLIED